MEGTVFEGVGSLKLGTHCAGDQEYEQYTLREYLAYRIFNLFTPRSFRARLAKATHVDSSTGKTLAIRYAMFIESEADVARRLEGRVVQLPRTLFRDLDPETLTLMMLFEYMIGNTDFSIFALHNVRLVQDQARVLYPIPYDFDLSGVVNARYAVPDRQLPIATVLDRLYPLGEQAERPSGRAALSMDGVENIEVDVGHRDCHVGLGAAVFSVWKVARRPRYLLAPDRWRRGGASTD